MYIMLNERRLNLLTKCVPSTLSKAAMIGLSYFVLELQDTSNLIFLVVNKSPWIIVFFL